MMDGKVMEKGIFLLLLIFCFMLMSTILVASEDGIMVLFDSMNGLSDYTTANVAMTMKNLHDENVVAVMDVAVGSGAELGKVENLDLSAYQYINMWVYSPVVSQGNFYIDIYNLVGSEQKRTGRVTITVNWQGWKLVSVPTNSMTDVDWGTVSKWRITTYGAINSWVDCSNPYLEVKSIWASQDDPYKTASVGKEMVVNYNPAVFTSDGGAFDTTPVKFTEKSFGVKVDRRREGKLTGTVALQSCAYLNMWVYVPAETIPEGTVPRLRFRVNDISTGTENIYSVYVNVDWTGWKLVTIPFSELKDSNGATLPASAVVTMFRMITNETSSPSFNTASPERIYLDRVWFSQEAPSIITAQLEPENGGESYYAVDKMLILALDKPARLDEKEAKVTVQAADGTNIENTLCQLAPDKIGVLLHQSLAPGTQYTVTLSYGAVYDGTYGCNPETVLSFNTEEAGITASVPGIYNGNVKLGGERITAGAAYDKLRSVAAVYNTGNEPKNIMLIIAVYNQEENELKAVSCVQSSVPGNVRQVLDTKIGGEIKAETGDVVRCFIWESDTLQPLKIDGVKNVGYNIDNNFFPNWCRKAVTFSYDDGPSADKKLIQIFNENNVKGTFNLCSKNYNTPESREVLNSRYAGHEIANHTKNHLRLNQIPLEEAISEINLGRSELEAYTGKLVLGFAYPYGNPNVPEITQAVKDSGAVYARPTKTTGKFDLPTDFMDWRPTCHHNDLPTYGPQFLDLPDGNTMKLLFVWGHSFEFPYDESRGQYADTWYIIEDFCKLIKDRTDIWKATNIEIYNYIQAQRNLVITSTYIYNPSNCDVYVKINGVKEVIKAKEIYWMIQPPIEQ